MEDHAACPKGSSVSVALITVSPGSQLPHVVVDKEVKCLTASVYAGAYFFVVVGEGIDVAYLKFVSTRHHHIDENTILVSHHPPNSLVESERKRLEVITRRIRSMRTLRPSRRTLRRMKDLLGLSSHCKTRNPQECRPHGYSSNILSYRLLRDFSLLQKLALWESPS